MLKKVFRFLFSVCLIVLGIGMSLYPAVRSEKIHMEAISYQKEVDNAKATLEKAINSLEANVNTPADNTVSTPVNNGDTTTSVKTGDESLAGMFATIALLSVAGYTVLRKKED